jgi:hypothetical protein
MERVAAPAAGEQHGRSCREERRTRGCAERCGDEEVGARPGVRDASGCRVGDSAAAGRRSPVFLFRRVPRKVCGGAEEICGERVTKRNEKRLGQVGKTQMISDKRRGKDRS